MVFTHQQSETLAGIIEKAQADGQKGLQDFIRNELEIRILGLRNELTREIDDGRNETKSLRNELINEIKDLDVRITHSQKDMLVKILGIVVGTVGMAVTILKLFP